MHETQGENAEAGLRHDIGPGRNCEMQRKQEQTVEEGAALLQVMPMNIGFMSVLQAAKSCRGNRWGNGTHESPIGTVLPAMPPRCPMHGKPYPHGSPRPGMPLRRAPVRPRARDRRRGAGLPGARLARPWCALVAAWRGAIGVGMFT